MRVLVFGRSGQLAQELARQSSGSTTVETLGRESCDLATASDLRPITEARAPALVINAAAYTAVDQAEIDREAAFALNAAGAGALARACAALDTPLIQVSTDYVFDGEKGSPYVETDPLAPLGVYGESKAVGESEVLAAGGRAAVVRVGWLYSVFGANFPKTMLRLAREREDVAVVADQRGRPTAARFVAETLLALGRRMAAQDGAAEGVFHLTPRGEATWADFAEAVFVRSAARGGSSARVKRIGSAEFPTRARRPRDSRLDAAKLEKVLGAPFPEWETLLDGVMDALTAQSGVAAQVKT